MTKAHLSSNPPSLALADATPQALGPFFWLAARAPWILSKIRPLATWTVTQFSRQVRAHTQQNALRIFGCNFSVAEQREYSRAVVNSFYEFVLDVGRSSRESADQLLARIEHVVGEREYRSSRMPGRGAVLVTAHMGSFEVGLAALTRVEPRVHVVFKRDSTDSFESMRTSLRQLLGVHEAPIDNGLSTWIPLRDALLNGDVVVMQADRALPSQKSVVVPFLHGYLRLPTGAIRLARLTGSLIIPVFTVRLAPGRFAVHLLPAIEPGCNPGVPDASDPTVLAVCKAIESMIAASPTQWLMLGPAFVEGA